MGNMAGFLRSGHKYQYTCTCTIQTDYFHHNFIADLSDIISLMLLCIGPLEHKVFFCFVLQD